VLPIGGLKQKVLAVTQWADRWIIPERNRADLDDVPQKGDDVPP
jgi:ATP-dependent Lon protease